MTAQRWRMVLWAAMLGVVCLLVWQARATLLPFAFGAILAYALSPLVDRLAALVPASTHRGDVYRRGFAVLAIYLVILAGLVAAGAALIPVAADQTSQFVESLPESVEAARLQVADWLSQYRSRVPADVQERVDAVAEEAAVAFANASASLMRNSLDRVTSTIAVVFGFVVVPFWMFYAMRDRHFVRNNFMNAVPDGLREDVENLLLIADRLLGRYIRGQLILGLVVGTAVGAGLTLMGVQLSLGLGLVAGITELIPILGPWIGAIPGLIIVAGTQPDMIVWVALLYLAVQQLENLLLVPRIQGHAVDIHPAMIILLLAVGGAAFGFLGLVVIVPLTAILRELFWYADRRLRGNTPRQALAEGKLGRRLQEQLDEEKHRLAARAAALSPPPTPTHPAPVPADDE
ncbi:MAG: AI-2E family transporter [Dehalococcoidia bacterium]|nr:AI-2E family transporter [Dehalococcoidia bacterium]